MATIVVDCGASIPGESEVGDNVLYKDKVDAIAIYDTVKGKIHRNQGWASEVQLVRYRDRATPKLAEYCASGASLGTVTVYIFNNDAGVTLRFTMALQRTYVSRIEFGTVYTDSEAYVRHAGGENVGVTKYAAEGFTANDYRISSRERATISPVHSGLPGVPTDTEVERIWLNYSAVTWTAADGNISGSYNNSTGRALA